MSRSVDEELAATAEQVEQRVAMGDAVETPRTVDHLAYFPRGRAQEAQEALRALGFGIDGARRRLFRTAVEFSRVDAVDSVSAAAFTREIARVVAEHDGEYDGWSGFAVSGDGQPLEPADAEPADAVPVGEVDGPEELARLRGLVVDGLVENGCDRETAARLSAEVELNLDADSYSLNGPGGGFWHQGGYSPSGATRSMADQVEWLVEENRRRRKPWWRPQTSS